MNCMNCNIHSYLSHGTNCLLDQPKRVNTGTREAQERTDESKLPGQIFSLDEQCKHVYDDRSYFCEVCFKIILQHLSVFKRHLGVH